MCPQPRLPGYRQGIASFLCFLCSCFVSAAAQDIDGLLDEGGVSTSSAEELDDLLDLPRQRVFPVYPRGEPVLNGLICADFFYRETLELPVLTRVPKQAALARGGLVASLLYGKGKFVICQLYPDLFHGPWQQTKVLRLWSVLLSNCGVAFPSLERTAAEDLPKVWYAAPALNFNPDKHRSW